MIRRRRRDRQGIDVRGEQHYLGELQAQIMEIAWARGRVTVREVHAELASARDLAYTTVMTVMVRLADDGVLTRERVGKTYFYRPAGTRDEFRAAISGTIVNDLVADFGDVALAQFAEALERADPERLARLRAFFAERERASDGA